MEIVKQIKQICIETNNEWFLTHNFPKIALCDLQLKETLEKENIFNEEENIFNERECICKTNAGNCIRCYIELERYDEIDKLNLIKDSHIFDYNYCWYYKSIWIIPEKINEEIPGFILIKCCNN